MLAKRASTTCGRIDLAHGSAAHQSPTRQTHSSRHGTIVKAQVGIRPSVVQPFVVITA